MVSIQDLRPLYLGSCRPAWPCLHGAVQHIRLGMLCSSHGLEGPPAQKPAGPFSMTNALTFDWSVCSVVDFGAGWFDLNWAFAQQRAMNAPGKSPPMCSEF